MVCTRSRDELSAWIDGELDAVAARAVEAHVARCSACSAHLDALRRLHRQVRVRAAEPVPDLGTAILAAVPPRPPRPTPRPRTWRATRLAPAGAFATVLFAALAVGSLEGRVSHAAPGPVGPAAARVSPTSVRIVLSGRDVQQPSVVVRVGTTVEWVNRDTVAHRLVQQLPGGAVHTALPPGATASVTFDDAGSYGYSCDLHPDTRGTVLVLGR